MKQKTKILQTQRRAPYLGKRGEFLVAWENEHITTPGDRRDYEALRKSFDFLKNDDEKPNEGDEFVPCFVWLQSKSAGAVSFEEIIEYAAADYMQKIIDRAKEYCALTKHEHIQQRMDGETAYHVRRVIKAVLANAEKKAIKRKENKR